MRKSALLIVAAAVAFSSVALVFAVEPSTQPVADPTSAVPATPALASHKGGELNFDQVAFTDAIDWFRDLTGANFVVDWKALQDVGISRDTPVSLRLHGVSIGVALRKTLDAAGANLLSFYVEDNIIHVTSKIESDNRLITRVYSVADLLLDVPDFKDAPNLSLSSNTSGGSRSIGGGTGSGGGGGGGSSTNLFGGGSGGGGTSGSNTDRKTMAERAQSLIDLIQETVQPDVWNVNGGKAAIRYANGSIVVTAPLSVQDAIAGRR